MLKRATEGGTGPWRVSAITNWIAALAFAPWDVVAEATRDVLRRNAGNPAHIFNLGHGVMPETDPTVLERVVELVHNEGRCDGVAS